jgi:hypothetical protein
MRSGLYCIRCHGCFYADFFTGSESSSGIALSFFAGMME